MTQAVLVPGAVVACLDSEGLVHRNLWLANYSDVTLGGQNATEWLIVSRSQISVVRCRPEGHPMASAEQGELASPHGARIEREADATLLRTVDWVDVQSIRTQAGVGGGMLQLQVAGQWIDMLRFSNAYAMRFHKVSRWMERMREHPETWSDDVYSNDELSGHDSLGLSRAESGSDVLGFDPPECPTCQLRLSTKEESCPRCMQKGQILARVSQLLRPYRRGALLLCGLTVLGVIAELIPPMLQQYMIDHVLAGRIDTTSGAVATADPHPPDFKTALLLIVLALAGSRVLLSIVGVFKGQLATLIGTGLTSTLRAEMVRKLQSLAIVYYDRHQVGSMLGRVAHDSEAMHGLMHQITGGFLLQIVQLFGVGAMLIWINPKLALFTLIPVPLVIMGTSIFWRKVYPRYYRLWDASSKQITVLSGMLSGIRVVKAFAQEDREYQRFAKTSEELRSWRLWVENANAWYSATMSIVFSLGGLIVWYVGGRDVIGSSMTLGELIAFLAYLGMFYAPLSALSNFTSWLTSFLTGSKRVLELLDTPLTVMESSNPVAWDHPRGEIRFEDVSFGYDRNQPVLKNVSFHVQPGEMIGIVGRSGSGKSTMVNLLGRFYDVQEGRITVDGLDLRDLSSHQLRERLGIVFQESFMFRGTIWRNLSFGKPQATPEQGLEAAKAAGAHDFICRQQLGYETLLGEQGAGLSGGEKQRLSIARTLLYDPKILVLDEATSNIDAEAEKSIQDALKVLIRGRTTIAIAHRLSTLRNADRILVFDQGRLIEQGTHAALLALDGTYARLVRIQTSVTKNPDIDRLLLQESEGKASPRAKRFGAGTDRAERDTASSTAIMEPPTTSSRKSGSGANGQDPDALGNEDTVSNEVLGANEPAPPSLRWLSPDQCEFRGGSHDRVELWIDGQLHAPSVFLVRTFPATRPSEYLSVRTWNETGEEVECGIVRDMSEWSQANRGWMDELVARRYLLRAIHRVHRSHLASGYLTLDVQTDSGPERFVMRWTQGQALDYGDNGKLIIDTNENRYVVNDIDQLPREDRERFLQYIYW